MGVVVCSGGYACMYNTSQFDDFYTLATLLPQFEQPVWNAIVGTITLSIRDTPPPYPNLHSHLPYLTLPYLLILVMSASGGGWY